MIEKCSFQNHWLLKDDGNDRKVGDWAQKRSESEVFCKVCSTVINISSKGFQALTQHASSAKHRQSAKVALSQSQLRLTPGCTAEGHLSKDAAGSSSSSSAPTIRLYNLRDKATTAELIWTLKAVSCNYSAASCVGIGDVFNSMFPGAVPEGFSLNAKKFRYLVTDALGPYFTEELLNDMAGAFFTLSYDETTNAGGKKELQTAVRYWSEKQHKVVSHYLQTFFLGKATAEDIVVKLKAALDNADLPLHKLLMLGSDGPNVNKKVSRLINEELLSIRKHKLVDIGFCNIHLLHNAFRKGLAQFGEYASDLIVLLHSFFDGWPSRWEDFSFFQERFGLSNVHFIKHSPTRWLTIENAAARVVEQWEVIIYYFLTHIPQKRPELLTSSCKRIVSLLKNPSMKAGLLFLCSSANIFTRFTGKFQTEEPLVHLIYDEVNALLHSLLGRICKPTALQTSSALTQDILSKEKLLPFRYVACGSQTMEVLNELDERNQLEFFKHAQQHYIAACQYILVKAPMSGHLLKYFRCLQRDKRTSKASASDMIKIATALPVNVDKDRLLDEWKLLAFENDCQKVARIDAFWNHFLCKCSASGDLQYPTVAKVVKAALSLSHGNADIERKFSVSTRYLTDDRSSMSERTLNAVMTIKDALNTYNNKVQLVPITKNLLTLGQNAHSKYQAFLDEEKRIAEESKKKKAEEAEKKAEQDRVQAQLEKQNDDILKSEEKLKHLREEEQNKHKAAERLFREANNRLKKALEVKNFEEANLAQAMLAGVHQLREQEEAGRRDADKLQKQTDKRKATLISIHVTNKKKKIKQLSSVTVYD